MNISKECITSWHEKIQMDGSNWTKKQLKALEQIVPARAA